MTQRMRDKYGEIFKLDGIPGRRRLVFLFDPYDCERVYRTEGPWPGRMSTETMQLYRKRREELYKGEYGLVVRFVPYTAKSYSIFLKPAYPFPSLVEKLLVNQCFAVHRS